MLNQVVIQGRMVSDAEVKTLSNGNPVTSFSVAVQRNFKNANGKYDADFIDCVSYEKTPFISKYFHKGSKIAICGSIQTRTYDKNGQKQYITEVFAEEAEFVESTNQTQTVPATQNTEPADSEDLPFE